MQCPNFALTAVLINQVAPWASMLSTNGVMDWTVGNTEHLDKLTTVLAARTLTRTAVHVWHVVVAERSS